MYKIIGTGSTGNAVLYYNTVLVDIGVTFAAIEEHVKSISIVLLTHEHKDHINIATLKKLSGLRPGLRIGCGGFMSEHVDGLRNIDIYEAGQVYDYGALKISPVKLYHDVPNFGYRLFFENKKILHATDTQHLEGINAKGYDLYAIEQNYCEDEIKNRIRRKQELGEFCYEVGASNSHLSRQQAHDFFLKNKADHSQLLPLHQSSNNL